MTQEHIVYKLQGKSFEAAKELEKFAQAYWKAQPPVVYPINMLDLQNLSRDTYAGMLAKLHEERPDLVKACGLDKPVTKVHAGLDAYPRAYVAWPEIYSTFTGPKSEYFMYAPAGHDGAHFEPEDGVELNEQETAQAGNALWAGGWMDNAPLATRPDYGVDLPASFDPKTSSAAQRSGLSDETQTIRVFRAEGESLIAMQDLRRREAAHSAAVTALFDHVKTMTPQTMQLLKRDGSKRPEIKVYANMSLASDGEEQKVMISIRVDGTGEPLPVRDTAGYLVGAPGHGGEVEIVPNLDSEAGKQFRDLLNSPDLARPEVRNYPALRYPAPADTLGGQFQAAAESFAGFPNQRTFGDGEYLVYRVERDSNPDLPGPPDAVPVSPAAFHWLDADATDHMRGIAPPPMPPDIAAELAKGHDVSGPRAPEAHP